MHQAWYSIWTIVRQKHCKQKCKYAIVIQSNHLCGNTMQLRPSFTWWKWHHLFELSWETEIYSYRSKALINAFKAHVLGELRHRPLHRGSKIQLGLHANKREQLPRWSAHCHKSCWTSWHLWSGQHDGKLLWYFCKIILMKNVKWSRRLQDVRWWTMHLIISH